MYLKGVDCVQFKQPLPKLKSNATNTNTELAATTNKPVFLYVFSTFVEILRFYDNKVMYKF